MDNSNGFQALKGFEGLDPVDKFGKFIMEHIRDAAVDYCEDLLAGRWKAPAIQSLQDELRTVTDEQRLLIRRCVISSVDEGIGRLLFNLQEQADFENAMQVFVDGINIVEAGEEGIHYEPYGEDGWIERFSKHGSSR